MSQPFCAPAPRLDAGREIPRGSTPRTHCLATEAVNRFPGQFIEQARLAGECVAPDHGGIMLRSAVCFAQYHPRLTPVIHPDELIVGARVRAGEGPIGGWHPDGFDWYIPHFAGNTPPERPDLRAMAERGLISPQGSLNHKVVDYAGFIHTGSGELIRRAREVAATRTGEESEFAQAFAIAHEAIIAHGATYAAEARRQAAELPAGDPRAAELAEIAAICDRVPAEPARTFREALQAFWFAYMVAGDAPGRMDVYLREFYEADLAAGRLTRDDALKLIECVLVKLHGDVFEGDMNVSSVQTLTLGGLAPDGTDATSDLTVLFLQAIRNVRLLRPTVYLRCHDTTPAEALDLAVTMLGEGLAEPNFFGDKPVIEGLTRVGIPLEEARGYALSGCAEVVSPGLGNWGAPNGWLNFAVLADEALRECAASGATSERAVWQALEAHVRVVAEACRDCNAWVDEQNVDPRFASTILMPVCLERCRDIAHGGAHSHLGHWEGLGIANAADMVHAALHLLSAGEDLAACFTRLDAGDPELRLRLRALPRFGNADPTVDLIAARLVRLMADALESCSTPLRPALVLGHLSGGENLHIGAGAIMGATLDGRRAGETLADSMAGSQGATLGGPTAVVRSLCALDHSRIVAGNVSTLRLSPADFATPADRAKVVALIRTFMAMGGSQLQLNVADAATLRAAQESPEEHAGLMVRVAGYSADFTHIGRSLQDEIIARTEGLT